MGELTGTRGVLLGGRRVKGAIIGAPRSKEDASLEYHTGLDIKIEQEDHSRDIWAICPSALQRKLITNMNVINIG